MQRYKQDWVAFILNLITMKFLNDNRQQFHNMKLKAQQIAEKDYKKYGEKTPFFSTIFRYQLSN